MPNILILGGTYFAGRVFTLTAARRKDFRLTLINRGAMPMDESGNITEYHCDRHDAQRLFAFPEEHFDALVDFCAYEPGDIRTIFTNLQASFDRYIYISHGRVYDPAFPGPKAETSPLLDRQPPGDEGEYLYHKRQLEDELVSECAHRGVAPVILRPALLYGPYNYAPREPWYIRRILSGLSLPFPTDADGRFQMAFVGDLARVILACVKGRGDGQVFNVAGPEVLNYPILLEALAQISGESLQLRELTVAEARRENLTLPFPATSTEDLLLDTEAMTRTLRLRTTPLLQGMEQTWSAFHTTYLHQQDRSGG